MHSINNEKGNEYPDLVNEILLKVQALIMKSIMKALNILNEIFNETAQHQLWNIQWNHTALIMKNAMKAPNTPNEIFNESAQH